MISSVVNVIESMWYIMDENNVLNICIGKRDIFKW